MGRAETADLLKTSVFVTQRIVLLASKVSPSLETVGRLVQEEVYFPDAVTLS